MGEGVMGAAPECHGPIGGMSELGDDGVVGALGDTKFWPPGFRFHPTDEELVLYYLKRKLCRRRIKLQMIGDVDVYKWEPWELPDRSVVRSRDKQWYFFSPRDRKYPNGSRSNRSTTCGYWKATGKDRTISQNNSRAVGNKKTLVYYRGRPPRGERTDWVMHEYTLDEQVLVRCNNVQDSYALYKVFRKSGPGPKNGEEYGAPFREEEWDINDDPDDSLRKEDDMVDPTFDQLPGDSIAATLVGNERSSVPICDLEDLLLQISSEQVTVQHHFGCSANASEVEFEADVGSNTLGPPYVSTKQSDAWCDQGSTTTIFDISQQALVYLPQPIETPDVESFTDWSEEGLLGTNEEFLEIKDFNEPESTVWSLDDNSRKDHVPETDGFYDPYDYFDANMYLAEAMKPLDGMASDIYFDGFDDDETQNQASHMISELWTHEQPPVASAAVESKQVPPIASPASGAVHNGSSIGDHEMKEAGSASESWFSTALSALLESIPSSPAIASENALISRALERVSSFKVGARDPNTSSTTAVVERRQGGSRGFLFTSVLVGVGAVLWVLSIGASVKAFKCLWGRF